MAYIVNEILPLSELKNITSKTSFPERRISVNKIVY
ncbi:hypothetical protein Fokcrypt_00636 [Candidatus Fokinia cryptica]|uniref:Uncharacterized protein n=1 Tax=Candidatus Fokinia crypta TaxID=1920990 RepID=A0ABZ0URA7_9RICK|nr:hypothetical protein Fokcrypt_00636 [Candidatus Fokinia cryptica]